MKTAICCIGKCENLYVRDYIEYYKKLGVDHIYIYDNNDVNGEHFEDAIFDYISSDYVTVLNVRGQKCMQMPCYEHCYHTYGNEYDWMLFIDCGDEFLELPNHNSISDFLSETYFNGFDIIHINLMTYGDCDILHYEDKPVYERFKTPIMPLDFHCQYNFPENDHISSIVRTKIENLQWRSTPHTPHPNKFRCCDALGNDVGDSTSPFLHPFNFTNAYFKHYTTKTIEEYVNKVKRGYPDHPDDVTTTLLTKNKFFKYNKYTEEKSNLFDKLYSNKEVKKEKTLTDLFL